MYIRDSDIVSGICVTYYIYQGWSVYVYQGLLVSGTCVTYYIYQGWSVCISGLVVHV